MGTQGDREVANIDWSWQKEEVKVSYLQRVVGKHVARRKPW
jgi:hypothetical protein